MMKRTFQSGPTSVVAAGTGLVAITYGVVRYGFGLQLPVLAREFSLSSGVAGLVAAGSFAAYCVAALAAQRLIDHRGARVVLRLAAFLAAAGATTVALASTTPVLAAGVLVAGSAAGATSPAMVVAVASSVRRPLAARAQAVVNAGTGVGVAVTGVAVLAAPQAWRPVWAAAAVGALLAALVVDRRTAWPGPVPPPPDHARGASLRRACAAAVVAGLGSAAFWTFGRDLVTTTGGLPGRTTAALWVLLGTAAVLGALSGDAVRVLGLRHAWTLTAGLSALGTALLALAPDQVAVVALAAALFGGAYTALSGVLIAWAGAVRPGTAGQATATLFVALTGGQALGAAATGLLADRAGALAAFWVCAVVLLAAAGIRPVGQASPSRSSTQASVNARRAQAW
ncbi:MFS transporter [Nocardioides aurantiacus]|uniref:Putative MFS family arabinose efflux permease n=1 Tax=Nocardioides aurantiacus TaxID=86796 RepID=A0A3N2CS12_9ACTN|nr:MFS transporter [Nocardioides aurantiacus]ROR90332.1 putative MFS family arabinose efflux permease [Nocardioides aurantiacus]